MRALALLVVFLVLPALAFADNYTVIDPLGHKRVFDEGGAEPSPDGTQFTFRPIDADVEVQLQGSGSQEPGEEPVFLGLNPMVFVGRTTALGISVSRPDLSNPDQLRFAPVFKHYIAVDPGDRWLKFVKFQPFSYWMATGEDGQTGLSVDWRLTMGPEIPLGGSVAFQLEAGILATLTHLNDDVTDTVDPMLGGTFIYRVRPTP